MKNGPFQEIELTEVFCYCKEGLWALWESIMLNKSVLLLGDNPQQVSHGVLGGISLIYPFEYCGNYNPYITVYDPNLEVLAREKNNWVFGGTNPVFEKFFDPAVTHTIPLGQAAGPKYKCHKNMKPIKDLVIKSSSEEQRAINEAAVHKHFGQLSAALITLLYSYLSQQSNVHPFLIRTLNFSMKATSSK